MVFYAQGTLAKLKLFFFYYSNDNVCIDFVCQSERFLFELYKLFLGEEITSESSGKV